MFISFHKTAQKAEKTVGALNEILDENKKPIHNFTNNTLVDFSALINDMREMSKTITQTAESIEKNKADFFFGSPDHKGVKID